MKTFRFDFFALVPTLLAAFLAALLAALLAGCAAHPPSPVRQSSTTVTEKPIRAASSAATGDGAFYTVKKGDTLLSIALDQGRDYKDIAAWNGIENPNLIKIGQQLRMSPPGNEGATVTPVSSAAVTRPIVNTAQVDVRPVTATPMSEASTDTLKREPKGGKVAYSEAALAKAKETIPVTAVDKPAETRTVEAKPADKPVAESAAATAATVDGAIDWIWPANGKMLAPFNEGSNKGVDIAGKVGDPVYAAAPGKVVYAGTGLRGYGKLVIVRHNAEFLSAYAHNNQILVKEGQTVTRRQVIAEIGSTDSESPRLHFEIRRQGKPVDPMKFFPAQ